jgi:hypothetical protein
MFNRDPSITALTPSDARALARTIAVDGVVEFSAHALEEMRNDALESTDCLNLIRAGVFQPPELEKGEWRYRVASSAMCLVITFRSRDRLRIITAWRKQS